MIERLVTRADTGAVTGYRWLLPKRHSLANLVLYCLNSSVATLFTSGGHHLLWGGCWAIRRELFDRLQIRDAWQGVLSDDLAASLRHPSRRAANQVRALLHVGHALGRRCRGDVRFSLPTAFHALALCPALVAGDAGRHAGRRVWILVAAGHGPARVSAHWSLAGGSCSALLGLVYGLQVAARQPARRLAGRYFPEHRRALAAGRLVRHVCRPADHDCQLVGHAGRCLRPPRALAANPTTRSMAAAR